MVDEIRCIPTYFTLLDAFGGRMKEQGEVIFLFYFSFVHSLEISPDLELIVTDCCELAVLRFSTTYDLGIIIVLLAMRCILIKHNLHIGVSASKGKGIPLY